MPYIFMMYHEKNLDEKNLENNFHCLLFDDKHFQRRQNENLKSEFKSRNHKIIWSKMSKSYGKISLLINFVH